MPIVFHRTLPENSTPPSIAAKPLHCRYFKNAVGLILADYYSYWLTATDKAGWLFH
jgi:hypothetical protein